MLLCLRIGLRVAVVFAAILTPCLHGQTAEEHERAAPKIKLRRYTVVAPGALQERVHAIERSKCGTATESTSLTTADLAGGKVKTIRVLRVVRWNKPPESDQIKSTLLNVWLGHVQGADCGILWSEGSWWSIESALEFQDGKRGLLIQTASTLQSRITMGRFGSLG